MGEASATSAVVTLPTNNWMPSISLTKSPEHSEAALVWADTAATLSTDAKSTAVTNPPTARRDLCPTNDSMTNPLRAQCCLKPKRPL